MLAVIVIGPDRPHMLHVSPRYDKMPMHPPVFLVLDLDIRLPRQVEFSRKAALAVCHCAAVMSSPGPVLIDA